MIHFFDIPEPETADEKEMTGLFLKRIYNETEAAHVEVRNAKNRKAALTELLREAEEKRDWAEYGEEQKKQYDFVMGNLYLRLGRCEEELFLNPKASYERTVELLQEYANPDDLFHDPLSLLIQATLGKYFRNLGRCGIRSNFYLAINEFRKVESRIAQRGEPSRENLLIWLDMEINVGRAYKNLYLFTMAKIYLIPMVVWLGEKIGEKEKRTLREIGRKSAEWRTELDLAKCENTEEEAWNRFQKAKNNFLNVIGARGGQTLEAGRTVTAEKVPYGPPWADSIYTDDGVDDVLYRRFFLNALVQLAIVFRKERKYDKAMALCEAVKKLEPENAEARNNLGVCFRKKYEYHKARKIFEPLKDRGNRFAEIEYWKCILKQEESKKGSSGLSEKEIEAFIGEGEPFETKKTDRERCLLQARFLLFRGKVESAREIFCRLYELYPYIEQGTIGLKAYYNMATCLMQREKYYRVLEMLDKILKVNPKDRLARIDRGWCLMKLNRYGQAKAIYEEMMEINPAFEEKELEGWFANANPGPGKYEKIKMYNNLGECYLHTGQADKAIIMFERVLDEEPANMEAKRFLARCHMSKGEELERYCRTAGEGGAAEAKAKEEYKDAVKYLEMAKENLKENRRGEERDISVSVESNLVIAKAAYLRMEAEEHSGCSLAKDYRKYMENRILYYPDSRYSQSACREMAYLLNNRNEKEEDTLTLFRAFSRIRLWEKEEGYRAFSHFMESHDFLCLGASLRGRILAQLFLLYGEIGQIKELCRYRPKDAEGGELTLAHYTKIETLRILLADFGEERAKDPEPAQNHTAGIPKLRLWNSVYMNDPSEGGCFLDMLQNAGREEGKKEQESLFCYFPHLKNNNENLAPTNGNVYIASLTERKDDLPMWLTYADKAKGCSIVFDDDFFDLYGRKAKGAGDLAYSDDDYPLYEVQYFDETEVWDRDTQRLSSDGKENKKEEIWAVLEQIRLHIEELEELLADGKKKSSGRTAVELTEESKNSVFGFAADALNEIRFLFKYNDYKREKEVRAVKCSYEPKIDRRFQIPRLYMEVDRKVRMKEVMLGAKVSPEETDEIVSWLYATGKVKKVTKSVRHFK